jgi:hypothetical protein
MCPLPRSSHSFLGRDLLSHRASAAIRYFPGTLTLDDPAVADELLVKYSAGELGAPRTEDTVPNPFTRLLTQRGDRDRRSLAQAAGFGTHMSRPQRVAQQERPPRAGDPTVGGDKPDSLQPTPTAHPCPTRRRCRTRAASGDAMQPRQCCADVRTTRPAASTFGGAKLWDRSSRAIPRPIRATSCS